MMIIKFKKSFEPASEERLLSFLHEKGYQTKDVSSEVVRIFGVIGDTHKIDTRDIYAYDCVAEVIRIQVPYKKASREFQSFDTVIDLGDGVIIGKDSHLVIAGPCSVEHEAQMMQIGAFLKDQGIHILRGGAFKPRTSPYSFQGLGEEGLKLMRKTADMYGLKVISEIPSVELLEMFETYVDIIQVGARNMQNFHLLKALGQSKKPIFLKRGLSSTIEEWLMSAEYILNGGNDQVILCERGIRTFETYTRNTLDINAVLAAKELSHLPVFIDPSHASGRTSMISPLAQAAVAVGAHGQMIEIHPEPEKALSDGAQSLTLPQFSSLIQQLRTVSTAFGKDIR
jgi:3-deoxy-7-phosphoheptulonate synthase